MNIFHIVKKKIKIYTPLADIQSITSLFSQWQHLFDKKYSKNSNIVKYIIKYIIFLL